MIRYRDDVEGVCAEQLIGFFEGWPRRPSPETHLHLLRKSTHVVVAVDDESGRVVGFITAITDGVLAAYIPFLEVLPDHQGRGIGRGLVSRMLGRLSSLYMVDLFCDPELQVFYSGLGMKPATGMMIRNYARQSG